MGVNLSYIKHQMIFFEIIAIKATTLDSGIDVWQGINVGPGKLGRKNKRRALNKHRV